MGEKFMNAMLVVASKIGNNRIMTCIRDAFTDLMPLIIAGSFCTLFSNVICNTTPGYVSLANVPGLSWLGVLKPLFDAANYGTMNFMAIGIVILLSMKVAESYDNNDRVVMLVGLASYISLCTTSVTGTAPESGEVVTIANALGRQFTNAQGLFVAMLVGIVSSILYVKMVQSGKLQINMPDSVPPNIARSFAVLFPATLTVLIVSGFGLAFHMITNMTLFDAITTFIQAPLKNILTGLPGFMFLMGCTVVLWWFGIHGTQTLKGVYEAILLQAFAENEAAYLANEVPPNIINTPFMSVFGTVTGAGITGGLLIAILLFSKREDYRSIAKLAIPCAIFNINEPVTFGLPIVMNPILGIPFILSPIVSVGVGYFLTKIGFCAKMVVNAPWTTPPGLMAFLAGGGSIGAAISQIIVILIAFAIYTPFVLISNKQASGEEA
ncbi:MAG: PTS sugar transporter subunit IIC [Solobacterium sp.]|nr:PTS sugar transporter subunit IIC [Solobacterium sp.]